ncbi:MAG: DUF952 domain-containing protein [Acidimicrobiales bacterium]
MLHIATPDTWAEAQRVGEYRADSLISEGFIHLSTPEQVLIPANERYAGRTDLVLLVIDGSKLSADLVFEDSYGSGIEFPHVYGPIDLAAVTDIVDFPSNDDGTFDLPASLH